MKLRTLGRHGKESVKSLVRNGWMTFASVSAVTVALLLVGLFLTVMLNLNSIANQIENNVEVHVFIDQTASKAQEDQLGQQLKQIPNVKSVKFEPKQQGLDSLVKSMGKDGQVFSSLKSENPLPDVYVIKTKLPKQTIAVAEKVKQFKNVSDVRYGKGTVENLFKVIDIARNVGIVLIIGLGFTAIFLIANTIKLTIVARSREIEIMKLVGATNAFVRWPYFLEGLFLGILGSILPILVLGFGYKTLYDAYGQQYKLFVHLIPSATMITYLGSMLLCAGAIIGVWGSVSSVRKFLKI